MVHTHFCHRRYLDVDCTGPGYVLQKPGQLNDNMLIDLGASLMGTMQLSFALAGEKVVIAGLALQVATIVAFLIAAIDFHIRMHRASVTVNDTERDTWKKMLHVLYLLSALVLFRCVFRLIEYATGNAAYLISHEWTLYVFDGVPMFTVLVLLLVWQPKEQKMNKERKVSQSSDSEVGVVASR